MVPHQVPGGSERTLYVLAVLARHGEPLSVAELAVKTGLAPSTLYRQLALLKRWGFVQETDGEYAPGPTCLQLAWGFDQTSYLAHEALPDMTALSERTNETVGLMVAVHDQVVCIDMVESRLPLRCTFTKGKGLPLLHGASAKALLAFLPNAQRQIILRGIAGGAGPDAIDSQALSLELEQIRRNGHAISAGEVDDGVWGISVPILPHVGKLMGAITLMAPITRVEHRRQSLTDLTVETAQRISRRLRNFD